MIRQAFYGVNGTSLAVHAPSTENSALAACDKRIALNVSDPWDLDLAAEGDIV